MRILLRVAVCAALLWVGVSGESGMEVVFGEGPNTKGEIPTYISQLTQDWIAQSIADARPCSQLTAVKDVGANLGWERMKALLGAGDEKALENIGDALGARTRAVVDVVQVGDQLSVTFSTLDPAGRATSRSQAVVSTSDWNDAFDKLEAFSKKCGRDLATQLPKKSEEDCSPRKDKKQAAEEHLRDEHAEARANEYSADPPRLSHAGGTSVPK